MSENDVTCGGKATPAGQRAPCDHGNDGLGKAPNLDEHIAEALCLRSVLVRRPVNRIQELCQIRSRAEIFPRAANGYHPNVLIQLRTIEFLEKCIDRLGIQGVAFLRSVERKGQHTRGQLDQQGV